jgi:molecular chaperone Hsp33
MTDLSPDRLLRFLFDGAPVRGSHVQLDTVWQSILQRHDYPLVIRQALGEMLAATALLTAGLKFDGTLILQMHGTGPVKLLVVECRSDLAIRATAKWNHDQPLPDWPLVQLLGKARCVVTIDPDKGEAYQGIVPIVGATISEILQHYMQSSEQLETQLWLAADAERASGLLLQKLPAGQGDPDAWNRTNHLAATLTTVELQSLPGVELLHRLFHEEPLRLLGSQVVRFQCSCSRPRVADMLKMLGEAEVNSVIAEQGHVEVQCDFCQAAYTFDAVDAAEIFVDELQHMPASPQRH